MLPSRVGEFPLPNRHSGADFGNGRGGAVRDGLVLRTLGGALDGNVPEGFVGKVVHYGPDPRRGAESPAPG